MSDMSKFSPLTGNLLVRKGEAGPSIIRPEKWTLGPAASLKKRAGKKAPAAANDAPKFRRLVLSMTPREYETLGLIAVKKGTTRHHIAQEAMAVYLDTLADEFGEGCMCIEACQRGCD
jgi:hypothetical protein